MHVGAGPGNCAATLCKVALTILEATWDLCDLAGLAFCLRRGLETLDFLETTARCEPTLWGISGRHIPGVTARHKPRPFLVRRCSLGGLYDELDVAHVHGGVVADGGTRRRSGARRGWMEEAGGKQWLAENSGFICVAVAKRQKGTLTGVTDLDRPNQADPDQSSHRRLWHGLGKTSETRRGRV